MFALILVIPFVILGACFVLVGPILFRLFQPCPVEEVTDEWLDAFSPANYAGMAGLLSDEDFRFLASQPGFDLSLYKKLRRERMLIFRQYMTRLILDFNRLYAATQHIFAQSSEDRSEIAARVARLKFRFTISVVHAEFSYLLCYVGFRSLAAQVLIARLEEMGAEVRQIRQLQTI